LIAGKSQLQNVVQHHNWCNTDIRPGENLIKMSTFSEKMFPMLEAVITSIDEGVMICEKSGELLYLNPAAIKLLGLSDQKHLKRLQDYSTFNLQRAFLRAAIDAGEVDAAGMPSGRFVTFEERIDSPMGERYIEFHTGMVDCSTYGGKVRLILLRDRTDQRNLESAYKTQHHDLQSNDPQMLELVERIQQIAPSDASVLLQGESGTGKTMLARMIHKMSRRSQQPFIELNCAAIPESLIESELFGHIKGAFTGASQSRPGRFQAANHGTLFLDEISEIPLHLQAKLLRAIQDHSFEMVGSDKTINVNVRIITASNKHLRELVDQGEFRADLFYRLAVIPLTLPSLRDRPGDIPLLTSYFHGKLVKRGYPEEIKCSDDAMRLLMNYPWPGNVRELQNAIEHGMICAIDQMIHAESLPQDIARQHRFASTNSDSLAQKDDLQESYEIEDALNQCNGSKSQAAKQLGIDRSTLWRRMQRLGIH